MKAICPQCGREVFCPYLGMAWCWLCGVLWGLGAVNLDGSRQWKGVRCTEGASDETAASH